MCLNKAVNLVFILYNRVAASPRECLVYCCAHPTALARMCLIDDDSEATVSKVLPHHAEYEGELLNRSDNNLRTSFQ